MHRIFLITAMGNISCILYCYIYLCCVMIELCTRAWFINFYIILSSLIISYTHSSRSLHLRSPFEISSIYWCVWIACELWEFLLHSAKLYNVGLCSLICELKMVSVWRRLSFMHVSLFIVYWLETQIYLHSCMHKISSYKLTCNAPIYLKERD